MAKEPKTETIKINKDRHGPTWRGGINGKMFSIPTGVDYPAEPELIEHLRNSGVSFETSEGAGSQEGSVDPVPETAKPHMLPRSSDDMGGGQSGDVVPAQGDAGTAEADPAANTLAERARISDIRVAAERRTAGDVSPAELAGEGEQGTPEAHPLDHDGDGRKGGSKPRASKATK